jgi:DNA-binding response OmpR family regulator
MGNPELGTLLIIDDEPDLVLYYKALFEDHDYKVISATDGEHGLELARKHAPDLICLDISMPAPSGVRVYRELRGDKMTASIPVVMVTGVPKQFEDFISRRKQVPPPDGYLSKPFDPEELLALVKKILAAKPAAKPS